MSNQWTQLEIGDGGQVMNARAHNSVVEAISDGPTPHLAIAWRTTEGDLQTVRSSNGQLFAYGMVFSITIRDIFLRKSSDLALLDEGMRFAPELLSLRRSAQVHLHPPDWFLEIESNEGDYILIAGHGEPNTLETKQIGNKSELNLSI